MLGLFLGPIISMLTSKGLNIAASAIEGGLDKGVEYLEDKTGIKLDPKKGLTDKEVDAIRRAEQDPEIKLKLEELALLEKKEDNRHDEFYVNKEIEDRKRAAEMFKHASGLQTQVANEILSQTRIFIPIYIILNIGLIVATKMLNIDATISIAAANLLGMGLMKAYEERAQIISFLFGAEIKKKEK